MEPRFVARSVRPAELVESEGEVVRGLLEDEKQARVEGKAVIESFLDDEAEALAHPGEPVESEVPEDRGEARKRVAQGFRVDPFENPALADRLRGDDERAFELMKPLEGLFGRSPLPTLHPLPMS